MFFVLSGYLIGRQLWKELKETGTIRIGRFLLRRGMRIWPLYFAAVLAYFIGNLSANQPVQPLLADVLFVSNYWHALVRGGWSLSTEEQFYIAAPTLLFLLRFLPRRLLVLVPLLWLAVIPVLRWHALANAPGVQIGQIIYFPFHLHSDGLAAGLVLSWLSVFCRGWWDSRRGAIWIPAAVLLTGVALRFLGKDVFSYTALAFIFSAFALFGLRVQAANQLASWRGFFVISRLSYGTYLNHLALIELLPPSVTRQLSPVTSNALAFPLAVLAVSAVSMTFAFVTFALIERPVLQWRDRLLTAKPLAVPGEAVLRGS